MGLYAVPEFLGIQFNSEHQVPGTQRVALGTLNVQPSMGSSAEEYEGREWAASNTEPF